MEATWQHMLEKAAHELVAAEAAGSLTAGLAFLVLDADRSVVSALPQGAAPPHPLATPGHGAVICSVLPHDLCGALPA